MLQFVLGAFLILGSVNTYAEATRAVSDNHRYFTKSAQKAYDLVFDLKLQQAQLYINEMKLNDSDNLLIHHIENLSEFLKLFINENPEEYAKYKHNLDRRMDAISETDPNSPFFLYLQAEIELQWAIIHLKFGSYFKAYRLVKSAYVKLEENDELYPNFIANKKSIGILHAILGTIPADYSWGLELISGMEGNIQKGQAEIEEVLQYSENQNFFFKKEVIAMYALLQVYIKNEPGKALKVLEKHNLNPRTEPISCFILANIAMKQGRNEDALRILSQRPQGDEYLEFHYLGYMYGLAKLYALDPTSEIHFKNFVNNYPGANYLKDAYHKLAWHALIFKDRKQYQYYMDIIPRVGKALTDEDKAADQESQYERNYRAEILKSRLLFDGGYYRSVLQRLEELEVDNLSSQESLEILYRKARATHQIGYIKQAISLYKQVIKEGINEKFYYATASALYLGHIYEKDHNYKDARKAYKLCLELKPDEYRASLHQKAKAGKIRISNNF